MGQCFSAQRGDSPSLSGHADVHKASSKDGTNVAATNLISATGGAADRSDSVNRSVREGLSSLYQVQGELGSGCQGKTWLCQDLTSGEHWAVKMVKLPLPSYLVKGMLREIRIQADLGEGHLNLITPEEVVLTSHYLGLVMEFAPGRSMTQYVSKKWKETKGVGLLMLEEEALYFFKQLVSAVTYIHKNQVVHRDLKLDNTLLSEDDPPYIKLCDFGFARGWGADANFDTIVGTADYMAPQLISAKMGKSEPVYDGVKADVWAMAVTLCVMLMGKFPFESETGFQDAVGMVYSTQRSYKIWRDNPELRDSVDLLSPECISLLDMMLEKDEQKRADLTTIAAHPWMSRRLPPTYQNALDKLGKQQAAVDLKMNNGKLKRHKEREKAISNLVNTAASDDFRKQATAPISPDFTFRLFNRINLRNPQEKYPVFDRVSVLSMMAKEEGRRTLVGEMLSRPGLGGVNWGSVTSGSHVQPSHLGPHFNPSAAPSPNPSQAQIYLPASLTHHAAIHTGSLFSSAAGSAAQHHLYTIVPGSSLTSQHGFCIAGSGAAQSTGLFHGTSGAAAQHTLYNIAGSMCGTSPLRPQSHSPASPGGICSTFQDTIPSPSDHSHSHSQFLPTYHNMACSSFRSTASVTSGLYSGLFVPIQPGQLGPQMLCPASLNHNSTDHLLAAVMVGSHRAANSVGAQTGPSLPSRMGPSHSAVSGSTQHSLPSHLSHHTTMTFGTQLQQQQNHEGPTGAAGAISTEGNLQREGRRSFPGILPPNFGLAQFPTVEAASNCGDSMFDCDIAGQQHSQHHHHSPCDDTHCGSTLCMHPRLDMVPEEAGSSCRPSVNISPMASTDGSHMFEDLKHSLGEESGSCRQHSHTSSPMKQQQRHSSGAQWLGMQSVTTPYGSATSIAAAAGGLPSSYSGSLIHMRMLSQSMACDSEGGGIHSNCQSPLLPSMGTTDALMRLGSIGSCASLTLAMMNNPANGMSPQPAREGGDMLAHAHTTGGSGGQLHPSVVAKSRSSESLCSKLIKTSSSTCVTQSTQRTSSGNSNSWHLGGASGSGGSSFRKSSEKGTDFAPSPNSSKRGSEAIPQETGKRIISPLAPAALSCSPAPTVTS